MNPVTIIHGDGPIVLAQPHSGTWLPDEIAAMLQTHARALHDTDWRIPELYEGLVPDATVIRANFSRYVIDANRPPDNASLYPGQNTTGLVPLVDFDGKPIWREEPHEDEIARRLALYHAPYHAALEQALERAGARHGFAILYDCHSIRSRVPFLFDGQLPDLNIGTNSGASCAPELERAVVQACEAAEGFTSVLNGRFKGGWTTRHYGDPARGIHAVQMEIAQRAYLSAEALPYEFSPTKSAALRAVLAQVLDGLGRAIGDIA